MSLRLWPIAMMSSFSLGTQRVNGCRDYAMACQTPFSSLALLFFPTSPSNGGGEAKLGIPARFNQTRLNAVAATHMLRHRRGNKTGILFRSEASPRQGLAPALQGEGCKDLQPSERLISAVCQTSENTCISSFKVNMIL